MAKTDESKSVQEFFYSAPEANSVQLVGDFTHWQRNPINLVKQADGVWKTSIALRRGLTTTGFSRTGHGVMIRMHPQGSKYLRVSQHGARGE